MTRQKSKKIQELPVVNGGPGDGTQQVPTYNIDPIDLRGMFKALDPKEQEAIINYFNLHNAAIWIFSSLSTPAVEYVNLSIKLSQETAKVEV